LERAFFVFQRKERLLLDVSQVRDLSGKVRVSGRPAPSFGQWYRGKGGRTSLIERVDEIARHSTNLRHTRDDFDHGTIRSTRHPPHEPLLEIGPPARVEVGELKVGR
jgi:hypothetical protein